MHGGLTSKMLNCTTTSQIVPVLPAGLQLNSLLLMHLCGGIYVHQMVECSRIRSMRHLPDAEANSCETLGKAVWSLLSTVSADSASAISQGGALWRPTHPVEALTTPLAQLQRS